MFNDLKLLIFFKTILTSDSGTFKFFKIFSKLSVSFTSIFIFSYLGFRFSDNEIIDVADMKDSFGDNIKEIAEAVQASGGFNLDDWLNQDFSITLDNYSRLVGNDWGIEINDFKDLTKAVNEIEGTNLTQKAF